MSRTSASLRLLTVLFVFASLVVTMAGAARAQQPPATADTTPAAATPSADIGPRFVIYPKGGTDGDYFTLQADPGSVLELVVVLGNADEEPLNLRTYASNVIPIVNGGFALAQEDVQQEGVTNWLEYPAETFEFAPGDGVERTFTLTVPVDTAPGQYITGLALETADPIAVEGTTLFEQVIRKTIAVFIIVPGPEEAAYSLGAPEVVTEGGLTRIVMPVANTGNVLVRPEGDVIIRDAAGEVVLTAPIAMGSVYAGLTVPLSVALTTPLNAGDYTVSAELVDPGSGLSASIADAPVTIVSPEVLATQVRVTGMVTLVPGSDNPAFADVALVVTNPVQPIVNAEIVLEVSLDGELVESYTLVPSVSLATGDTAISQRYVPITGWEAGTWSFVVRVNAVDPSTSTTTLLATLDSIAPVQVGA
ncbi:MAG: hypothetical protein R2845_08790 [Thermomicrobiales bacterium]